MPKEIEEENIPEACNALIKVVCGPFIYEATETDAYIFMQKLSETEIGRELIHSEHLNALSGAIYEALSERALLGEDDHPTDEFKERLNAVDGGRRAYMFGHGITLCMEEIIEIAISRLSKISSEEVLETCGKFPKNFNILTFDWGQIKLLDIARITGWNYEYWKITIDGIPKNYTTLSRLIYERIDETWPFSEIDFVIYRPNEETELIAEFCYK